MLLQLKKTSQVQWSKRLIVLLPIAVFLLAYVPVMRGGYIWDDDAFVTDNKVLQEGAGGLCKLWFKFGATQQYYPLTYSTFWAEYHVWGLAPKASHVVNVLLHGLNAVLLWRLLRRLAVPGAGLAAMIFAVHPVEVESVGWITERKNVLSGAFYLAAVLCYLRFQRISATDDGGARDWRFYAIAIFLFLCSLWSKTVTCTMPAAILLLLWWKQPRVRWRDLAPLVPLFILGAGIGLVTAWMEKHYIGAKGNDWSLSKAERLLIAGRALWFYVGKMAWPIHLAFFYPRWILNAHAGWQWLFPVSAGGFALSLWMLRQRIGKGPIVAASFFAVTLVPALGFFDVYPFRYSFVADHFQYLAGIGPLAIMSAGLVVFLNRFGPSRWMERGVSAGLVIVLSLLTWRQGRMYRDIETFYLTAIDQNPAAWIAHDNVAFAQLQEGKTDECIYHERKALELRPADAEAHINLGNALISKGQVAEAIEQYSLALQTKPDYAEAESDLGNALYFAGRVHEAVEHYERAIKLKPEYAEAYNNLGYALMQIGRLDDAIDSFHRALEFKSDYPQARANLSNALSQKQHRINQPFSF